MALILADRGLTSGDERVERTAGLIFSGWLGDEVIADLSDEEVCVIGNTPGMLARFGYMQTIRT